MEVTELVEQIIAVALAHDDLPDVIVAEIVGLASATVKLQGREELLRTLLGQLHDYDPYAGSGCFGGGITLGEIRQSLDRLRLIVSCD